jgi:hypothetical protein
MARVGNGIKKPAPEAQPRAVARTAPDRPKSSLPPAESRGTIKFPSRPVGYFVPERQMQALLKMTASMSETTQDNSPSGWTFASVALSGCFEILTRYFGAQLPQWTDAAMVGATAAAFLAALFAFVKSRSRTRAESATASQILDRLEEIVVCSDCEITLP